MMEQPITKKRQIVAKKASEEQKLYLISFMEMDPNFAHDKLVINLLIILM